MKFVEQLKKLYHRGKTVHISLSCLIKDGKEGMIPFLNESYKLKI